MKKIIRICRAGIICVGFCRLSMRKTHVETGEYGLMMTKKYIVKMPFYAEKIYICSVNRPERVVAGPAGYMLQGFPPA